MRNFIATKGNLQAAKRGRVLARAGFSLMDKKQSVLSQELLSQVERAKGLQGQMEDAFSAAYSALQRANVSLGHCERWAEAIEEDISLSLRWRGVMGLELPILAGGGGRAALLPYGFTGSDSTLDEALVHFTSAKTLVREMAEVENTIYRLAYALRKTRKRARALAGIVIPRFDASIGRMEEVLAQREQEEFVRKKIAKMKMQ